MVDISKGYLSPSQLSDTVSCPEKEMHYLLGHKIVERVPIMEISSEMHKRISMAKADPTLLSDTAKIAEVVKNIYCECLKKGNGQEEDLNKKEGGKLEDLIAMAQELARYALANNIHMDGEHEKKISFTIHGSHPEFGEIIVPVIGYVDWISSNNVVADFKMSGQKVIDPMYRLQTALYCMAVKSNVSKIIHVHPSKSGAEVVCEERVWDEQDFETVRQQYINAWIAVKKGIWWANPNFKWCCYCSYKKELCSLRKFL